MKMIQYAHFAIPNGNSVKGHQWTLRLLGKKLLESGYSHTFKTHTLFTNYKGENIQWRDLAPPQLSGQI